MRDNIHNFDLRNLFNRRKVHYVTIDSGYTKRGGWRVILPFGKTNYAQMEAF